MSKQATRSYLESDIPFRYDRATSTMTGISLNHLTCCQLTLRIAYSKRPFEKNYTLHLTLNDLIVF